MIKIAKNNDLWLESLVHEYGHFIQWVNSSPIYAKSDKAIINVEKWFLRKKMSKMKIKKSFQTQFPTFKNYMYSQIFYVIGSERNNFARKTASQLNDG